MHPFDPTCLSSLELLWFEMVLHGTYLRKVTYDDSLAVYCNDDGTTIKLRSGEGGGLGRI